MLYLLLLISVTLWEGEPPAPNERVTQKIQELGDETFEAREAAQRSLIRMGRRAYGGLIAARTHRDLEIRSRVERILDDHYRPWPTRKMWRINRCLPRLHALTFSDVQWRRVSERHFLPWGKNLPPRSAAWGSYEQWADLPDSGVILDWCYVRGEMYLQSQGVNCADYDYFSTNPLTTHAQAEATRHLFWQLRKTGLRRWVLETILDVMVLVEEYRYN